MPGDRFMSAIHQPGQLWTQIYEYMAILQRILVNRPRRPTATSMQQLRTKFYAYFYTLAENILIMTRSLQRTL